MNKILITFAIAVFLAAASALYVNSLLKQKVIIDEAIVVKVPRGTSISKTVSIFNGQGMLKPEFVFTNYIKFLAKIRGKTIYAGYYRIESGMSQRDIIEKLFGGGFVPVVKITFPEGITIEEFARLAKKTGADSLNFITLCRNDSILNARKIDAPSLEGYLMPDTYEFFKNSSAEKIINKLLDHHEKLWYGRFEKRADSLGISRGETLTLASIIELETSLNSEMQRISGVYHNRLKSGMLLQADPTVQYATGNKSRVTYDDLKHNSPYNTYLYGGLPPAPICSPGEKAIEAALYPEKHSYYYFVAAGDGTGRHNFAKNHAGHLRNVAEFRRNRRR